MRLRLKSLIWVLLVITSSWQIFTGINASEAKEMIPGWLHQHESPVRGLSYSPDGRTLASGSRDNTI